jgi:hypothetical protein
MGEVKKPIKAQTSPEYSAYQLLPNDCDGAQQ